MHAEKVVCIINNKKEVTLFARAMQLELVCVLRARERKAGALWGQSFHAHRAAWFW